MELINPKPIRDVSFDNHNANCKFILFHFAFSLVIIIAIEYLFLFKDGHFNGIIDILKLNSLAVAYVLVAGLVNTKPDYNNLGWVPFLVDNPFRISDNGNRFLVLVNVFLLPGKYLSKSIVDFCRFMRHKLF